MTTRRAFLAASSLAAAAQLSGADKPKLGLIFPPVGQRAPEEGLLLYASKVEFVTEALGLQTMTPEGYDAVLDRIPPAAERLAKQGCKAVMLMGTSLSFYKGAEFNMRLTETLKKATGLPCATMSTGVIEGLKALGAKRIAVPTAYNEEVNSRLRIFLKENGIEPLQIKGLGVEKVEDINKVQGPQLLRFCTEVVKSTKGADTTLVSCGGLVTAPLLAPLEKNTRLAAVSSTPHSLRLGVKLLGLDARVPGYGKLFAKG